MTKNNYAVCSKALWNHYDQYSRSDLLWRKNITPYRVVVSEIMLQQTQVSRVEEYFARWMKKYPSWKALANTSLKDVLLDWQGLGYNRRGVYLHDTAQVVTDVYKGRLPSDRESLESLPGIGHYTAGSIRAFAFNQLDYFLETNVRTVLIHHLYSHTQSKIDDKTLLDNLTTMIDGDARAQDNPRDFYYAMMDYGSYLKKTVGNKNKQSKTYTKQSRFEGSRRQLRSGILRYVLHNGPVSEKKIIEQSMRRKEEVIPLLQDLLKERSIVKEGNNYFVK